MLQINAFKEEKQSSKIKYEIKIPKSEIKAASLQPA